MIIKNIIESIRNELFVKRKRLIEPTSSYQITDASKMKSEKEPRVYMSKGSKGVIEIKSAFIHEFKQLRICDIPMEFRKYFNIPDYSKRGEYKKNAIYK